MNTVTIIRYFFSLAFIFCFCTSYGQPIDNSDSAYVRKNYTKVDYRILMRDGKKLFTSVYIPKDQSKKYPIMMQRTCYSVAPYGENRYRSILSPSSAFLHDGYIFVYQDVRGRWMSEGVFREMTPELETHNTPNDVDEGTDTYDTIEWLLEHISNNNGKVGVWGISYPGFFATTALLSRHPALVAVSPQAPQADQWRDDGWHNGAFMLAENFDFYPRFTNRQNDTPTQRPVKGFDYQTMDGFAFYMRLGPTRNVNDKYFKDTIRLWNDMMDHPDYDKHWQDRNVLLHLHDIKTAVLVTGGWYDISDLYGSINTYKTLVEKNPQTEIYFAMGPWAHGGWAHSSGDHLGDVDFGSATSLFYRENIEFRFFSHYLKGTDLDLPAVSIFATGVNQWRAYDRWPPKQAVHKILYMLPDGKLSFDTPPASADSYEQFVSDPAHPVPYIGDIDPGIKKEYMTADQRFAQRRSDVVTWQTDVLTDDVTLAGNIGASLQVSTTGTDADWVVKVIDVYPDSMQNNQWTNKDTYLSGYEQMVRSEVMRGKYRNNFAKPEPFIPGKITTVGFELQDVLHTFRKGHRIMVQVQSTCFPLIDRNPQQFTDIMKVKENEYQKATERVYTSKVNPSYLKVMVL